MSVTFRPLALDEDDFIRRVFSTVKMEVLRQSGLDPAQLDALLGFQYRAQQTQYSSNYPRAEYAVIEWNVIPAGYFILDDQINSLLVVDIAILPEYRRKGVARNVVEQLKVRSKQSRNPIQLNVMKQNERGIRFWLACGFEIIHEREVQYEMEFRPILAA